MCSALGRIKFILATYVPPAVPQAIKSKIGELKAQALAVVRASIFALSHRSLNALARARARPSTRKQAHASTPRADAALVEIGKQHDRTNHVPMTVINPWPALAPTVPR